MALPERGSAGLIAADFALVTALLDVPVAGSSVVIYKR